jgi:NAD(P)-dependent dehydrogenase (short-subunit alcohol dehydrogenase family)
MDDSIVFITGGNGDIGCKVVSDILEQTNNRILIATTPDKIGKKNISNRVEEIAFDATDSSSVDYVIKKISSLPILYFIQLHGNSNTNDTLESQTINSLEYHHNVNVFSTTVIISALLNEMKRSNFGRILLMNTASSEHGGGLGSFGYGMSKHSTSFIAKHIAKYYSKYNIICNCVSPGFINTKFHSEIMGRTSEQIRERSSSVRLQRSGTVTEVSNLIAFLTFNNDFITGQNIKIDGGDFV